MIFKYFRATQIQLAAIAFITTVFSPNVVAQAGIFEVVHPDVEKGEVEIEILNGFSTDSVEDGEESSVHEIAVGYGFTDSFKFTVAAEIANPEGDSAELEAFELEALYLLPGFSGHGHDDEHDDDHDDEGEHDDDEKESVLTLGLFAALEAPREDGIEEGAIEFGPVFEYPLGSLEWVGNLLLEVPFGEGEAGLVYATQLILPVNDRIGVGLESFGEFEGVFEGESEESIIFGPAVYFGGTLGNGHVIEPRVALLFGLNDEAPDSVLSLNIEYKF